MNKIKQDQSESLEFILSVHAIIRAITTLEEFIASLPNSFSKTKQLIVQLNNEFDREFKEIQFDYIEE